MKALTCTLPSAAKGRSAPGRTIVLSLLLLLLCVAMPACGQGPRAESLALPGAELGNFHRVDSCLYRSSQPDRKALHALEAYGITDVINLRRFWSDDKKAEGTSLRLHRVKMKSGDIGYEEIISVLRIIRDARGLVLVHCWHGSDRTGAVIAMYRIVFQGITKEDAVHEMTQGGYGFHSIYRNIPRIVLESDVEAIRRELGIDVPPATR